MGHLSEASQRLITDCGRRPKFYKLNWHRVSDFFSFPVLPSLDSKSSSKVGWGKKERQEKPSLSGLKGNSKGQREYGENHVLSSPFSLNPDSRDHTTAAWWHQWPDRHLQLPGQGILLSDQRKGEWDKYLLLFFLSLSLLSPLSSTFALGGGAVKEKTQKKEETKTPGFGSED